MLKWANNFRLSNVDYRILDIVWTAMNNKMSYKSDVETPDMNIY